MEAMRIENHIKKIELLDVDDLTPLQGGLKKLSDENFNKLRQSLIEKGFQFTVHVWEQGGTTYIIDGHQRVHVMKQLKKAGWDIPKINCAFVTASTYAEAKELILYSVSQYGKIDQEGFEEFTMGEDFDFSKFDLPDFDLELPEFDDEDGEELNVDEVEGNTKMSEELHINDEFLVLIFKETNDLKKFNDLIKNNDTCGYWLSKHKRNPAFFRQGPNRVLNGKDLLAYLEKEISHD